MREQNIQHLYWRAGFGVSPKLKSQLKLKNKPEVVKKLFNSSKNFTNLKVLEFSDIHLSPRDLLISKKKRDEFKKMSLDYLKKYNIAWLKRMTTTNSDLRERMTLFWANHFVCRDKNIIHVQNYYNTLRKYALGDFSEFVKAVSKEAAMIKYLNLKENKKSTPNENFARELMELFTIGMGNYSEKDVRECARAFTGYNYTFKGDFELEKKHVDIGIKTFFGEIGRFNGDDIIDIILKQKQCARFICIKVYRYFVNEEIDKIHISKMTDVFYKNYNIEELMRFIFTSDWFYESKNIGVKIKSPVDLLVGIYRTVPFELNNEKDYIKLQHILGQKLLNPPNVAGWKGGRGWIDVNTIMIRLRLPSLLLNEPMVPLNIKNRQMSIFRERLINNQKRKFPFQSKVNWEPFWENYASVDSNKIKSALLNVNASNISIINHKKDYEQSLKEYCIQLMSLPEYQMC